MAAAAQERGPRVVLGVCGGIAAYKSCELIRHSRDPVIPAEVGRMRFHGIHAFGTHVDVEGEGSSGQVTLTT